ncbi:mirror-image polydactyly gene 1 protein isoform X2 [Bombina bombina]|uniref:mirror-image polydactyly gene 1 protein isoform X2 n=1 Tax=Bombina bombina TaxID=8345 RepID=UPI00235ACB6F|nr:mirror-image polydactyly gene 1 protein isoform X2 [Bombina bombina]
MENFLEDGDSKKTENLNPGQGQHQLQIELKCTGLKNMPTPSPRSFSFPRIGLQEQNEGLKANLPSCDRPGSLHNSDHQAACTVEGGEHNLAAMAKELDYLRQANKKLQEALMTRERELETLKLDAELQEQAAEARIAEKTAGLVEEVYRAQRERDEAVMARLRLANEERDEALLRVQQFKLYLKELEDISSEEGDSSLQELLCRLWEANGSTAIQQNGNLILELIRKSRERRDEITADEMGAVIRERDSARAQCKHLEEELHLLRESKQTSEDIVTTEKTLEPPCKAELTFLQSDQDKVIENYKQLEEELQTLRVYYSLHQSLTQEVNLKEQYSKAITIYENALKNREELLSIIQQQNHQLCFQLQQAQGQNAEIQESLQRATSSQREAEEKVHKLERLVDVLRKKVGVGNVRTVI